jgi:tetratricopeptide (TPR) repeat protein
MKIAKVRGGILSSAVMCAAFLYFAPASFGQSTHMRGGTDQDQQQGVAPALNGPDANGKQPGQRPQIDPLEDAAYKAFHAVSARDSKKKIELGKQFLEKYPKSSYTGAVYDQLVKAYYVSLDWDDFFAAADKAIAINPNDLDVLPLVGWVTPRIYKATSPDGQKKLDQAESYNKHAIDLLATTLKPDALTEVQFAELKSAALSQSHSGLGLIYFQEQKPEDAAKELQQVTAPDVEDLFFLGASYEIMNRHAEAADEFRKCSALPGQLQVPCQQNLADATKEAAAK